MNERAFTHHEMIVFSHFGHMMLVYLTWPRLKAWGNSYYLSWSNLHNFKKILKKNVWKLQHHIGNAQQEWHAYGVKRVFFTAISSVCGAFCDRCRVSVWFVLPLFLVIYDICNASPHKANKEHYSGFNIQ